MEASIDKAPKPNKVTAFYQATQHASLGIELAVAVVLGWFMGQYLDARWGTDPWLMLAGTLCGIGAGIKAIIRVHRDFMRAAAKASAAESKEPR